MHLDPLTLTLCVCIDNCLALTLCDCSKTAKADCNLLAIAKLTAGANSESYRQAAYSESYRQAAYTIDTTILSILLDSSGLLLPQDDRGV